MSELDKYFEKARNAEPIYEEDDAKKLLYGKLSDGGIATNLYHKIKAYPMIATLITSVATIATIALLSISTPNEVTEKNSPLKHATVSEVNSTIENEKPNEKPEDLDWTEEKQPTSESSVALLSKEKEELNKKPKALNWTEEKIDIKSVNSLKLTKDELAQLGIVIDSKSFKINAFDKFTYVINKNNEKQRNYYDSEKDRDALPTPAMVTTSTGFKTLTLFKKGNVEATVDRYTSESEDGKSSDKIIAFSQYESDDAKILNNENFDSSLFLNNGSYSRDLLLRDSDSMKVVMLKSYETTENGGIVNVLSDRNVQVFTKDMNLKDIDLVLDASLDSLINKNTTLIEVDANEELSSNDPNNRTIRMDLKSLGKGKKLKIINKKIVTELHEENDDSDNFEIEIEIKKYSILGSNFNYNINELIPIEISFDGVKTDFIVWYEAKEEFLKKLPINLLEKINPELAAISEQAQHCD
ncbi:MAG: hypothetical protein RIF34_09865, partial [Candidatus Kapaibacterium sp.]